MSNLKIQAGSTVSNVAENVVDFALSGHTVQLPRKQRFQKKEPGTDGYGRFMIRTSWGINQPDGTVKFLLWETSCRVCAGVTQADLTNSLTAHKVPVSWEAVSVVAGDFGLRMPLPTQADVNV